MSIWVYFQIYDIISAKNNNECWDRCKREKTCFKSLMNLDRSACYLYKMATFNSADSGQLNVIDGFCSSASPAVSSVMVVISGNIVKPIASFWFLQLYKTYYRFTKKIVHIVSKSSCSQMRYHLHFFNYNIQVRCKPYNSVVYLLKLYCPLEISNTNVLNLKVANWKA